MKLLMAAIALSSTLGFAQTKEKATTYKLNTEKTKILWTGKKVAGPHTGYVKARSGSLTVLADEITSGQIVVDMNSITCTDLEGEWKDKLEAHLKSPDFFDTAKYPEATMVIKNSKMTNKGLEVTADITIRGITKPLSFIATDVKKTADTFSAKANIVVDRMKHGIAYNAGKGDKSLVKQLGDKLIYDEITLNIELQGKK